VKQSASKMHCIASKSPQLCDAWCQLFAKWLEVSAIRERPVRRYCEACGLGSKRARFCPWNLHSDYV